MELFSTSPGLSFQMLVTSLVNVLTCTHSSLFLSKQMRLLTWAWERQHGEHFRNDLWVILFTWPASRQSLDCLLLRRLLPTSLPRSLIRSVVASGNGASNLGEDWRPCNTFSQRGQSKVWVSCDRSSSYKSGHFLPDFSSASERTCATSLSEANLDKRSTISAV